MMPLISRNWRRTSTTTEPAARPTASIAIAPNRYGTRPPMNRPMITAGSDRLNACSLPSGIEVVRVVREQHQRGETGRADRVTLGDGLGRVADRVERVGDLAHVLRQARHLGDAAAVVGDRTVGVERDDHAGHRQHGGRGDRDAVQTRRASIRAPDRGADREHRPARSSASTRRGRRSRSCRDRSAMQRRRRAPARYSVAV